MHGRACLAWSTNGKDFFPLGSEDDKDNDGDCFGDSKSVLERAADACILPLVDVKRNRELVWWRKDFGTKSGWREIRGVQCAGWRGLKLLDTRFRIWV